MDVALQPPVSGLQRTPEENNVMGMVELAAKYSPVAHSDVLPSAAATREPSTTAAAHGTAVPGAGGARVAGGGAERRAQGYVPRRPVSALPVAYCLVGAIDAWAFAAIAARIGSSDEAGQRLGINEEGVQARVRQAPGRCRYQLCVPSHRLQWQERVGWRIEALPEAMTGLIHDNEVATVVKLCTASASGRGVGAPHNRAVVINKGQAPVLPEGEPGALAVH
uniref:Uncharacterized protein n=1 Tax=Oryza punctata TaxID=4537 RepID=A0A0E0L8A8_ORYPU